MHDRAFLRQQSWERARRHAGPATPCLRPSWVSEMISCTPLSLRAFSERRISV
jgi:hypothetical protein